MIYTVRPITKASLIEEARRINMNVPENMLDTIEFLQVMGVPTLRCDGVYMACELPLPLGAYSEVMVTSPDIVENAGQRNETRFQPVTKTILLSDLSTLTDIPVPQLIEYYADISNASKMTVGFEIFRVTVIH